MRPWTIDADDIHIASDFDSHLLHKTPWIENFLDEHRDDKFIVMGPKGFGKTLLLKAKRIAYQKGGRRCIPHNSLLDKPIGDKIFSRDMIALYGDTTKAWQKLWLISIAVTVLKELKMTDDIVANERLVALLHDRTLGSVLDHFVNLLDFPRNDLFRCANDTDNRLIPRLRTISDPIAVFVDSIDEYFNKHLTHASHSSDAGESSPEVWYLSQMALVEVAYQLRRISHHLKVFAAVRKEAFERLAATTPMAQQYRGSTIDIVYSRSSLREIFANNIGAEKPKNLVSRSALREHPIEAFLGRTHVDHGQSGEREDVFDYIHRHTLGRPRDLMTMGQTLAGIVPEERQQEDRLRSAVHAASTAIADAYLNEIEPYVGNTDVRETLALFPSNVLTQSELRSLIARHDEAAEEKGGDDGARSLYRLHAAGLLGHAQTDSRTGATVQKFLVPGEVSLVREGSLPNASHFLVHPMLTEVIARLNPDFALGIDRSNIIGSGRPWIDPRTRETGVREEQLFVLHADVKNFSKMMEDDRVDEGVRRALDEATKKHASRCLYTEVVRGDTVAIVHNEPNALLKAATRIREDLFEAPGNPELRMAVDYGPVKLKKKGRKREALAGGTALWRAVRIEPLVSVGEIWGTEEFKQQLEKGPTLYTAVAIEPEGGGSAGDARFNLKKPGSDGADAFVRLYRIGPRA